MILSFFVCLMIHNSTLFYVDYKFIKMELYDLSVQVLDSIFTANINQEIFTQYTDWHQSLDPSFKCLKNMINQYLLATQSKMLRTSASILLQLFQKFAEFRFPRTFVRAYLSILQQNLNVLDKIIKINQLTANWKNVHIDILQCYLNAFGIEFQGASKTGKTQFIIPLIEIEAHMGELIEKKEYDTAMKLIKLINYPSKHLQTLFKQMVNNKQASKAANFLKSHGIDSSLYPQINKRLSKNMIKYFLNSVGWDAAEQIFCEQADALWNLIEDLLQKKKEQEAKSVWFRNKKTIKDFKQLGESLSKVGQQWEKEQEQISKNIIPNIYFSDYFGPSDKAKHLTLLDLEVEQSHVIFLNKQDIDMTNRFVESLSKSDICAIDTESIVGKTKLDKKKQQAPSIIQVALPKQVFIIDCNQYNQKVKQSLLQYLSSQKLTLGHALQNDLDGVLIGLGLALPERKLFKFGNVIDTCKLFKLIYPKERHSNLAHICLKVLGKQICKKQTLTNWARRPLRRSQIHYAALDALCVIHIYRRYEQQVGPNMLTYFIEQM